MKLNEAASESELYLYVMQSIHDFEQAVASEMASEMAQSPGAEQIQATGPPDRLANAFFSAMDKLRFQPLEGVVDR